jgi:hypothetical protein
MSRYVQAALLTSLSVFAFAAVGLFQQRLSQYSVITVVGFRLLAGALCLALWAGSVERSSELFSTRLWREEKFVAWTALFAATVILYGFAFIGRSLPDVCTIVGFVPLFVIMIDVRYYNKPFPALNWIPVGIMFAATISPSIYQMYKGHTASVFSVGTYFALLGAVSHASWVLMNRTMVAYFGKDEQGGRLFHMFLWVGVILLLFSNMEAARELEELFRKPGFQMRFVSIASGWQYANLFFAGLSAAVSVLAIAEALARQEATKIIPYQYLLAVFGTVFAFVPEVTRRPEFTPDVHLALGIASVFVLLGAALLYWLNEPRDQNGHGA